MVRFTWSGVCSKEVLGEVSGESFLWGEGLQISFVLLIGVIGRVVLACEGVLGSWASSSLTGSGERVCLRGGVMRLAGDETNGSESGLEPPTGS